MRLFFQINKIKKEKEKIVLIFSKIFRELNIRVKKILRGFSLIELIVVLVIIRVLGTIVAVSVNFYLNKAKDSKVKSDIASILEDLQIYFLDHGTYQGYTLSSLFLNPIDNLPYSLLIPSPKTFLIYGRLSTGKYWCADWAGVKTEISESPQPKSDRCISQEGNQEGGGEGGGNGGSQEGLLGGAGVCLGYCNCEQFNDNYSACSAASSYCEWEGDCYCSGYTNFYTCAATGNCYACSSLDESSCGSYSACVWIGDHCEGNPCSDSYSGYGPLPPISSCPENGGCEWSCNITSEPCVGSGPECPPGCDLVCSERGTCRGKPCYGSEEGVCVSSCGYLGGCTWEWYETLEGGEW